MTKKKPGPRRRHPTPDEWITRVKTECAVDGVDAHLVLAGERGKDLVAVRRKVWKALYDTGDYSITGIAAASGFNHTSVMNAIGRINSGMLAFERRQRRNGAVTGS